MPRSLFLRRIAPLLGTTLLLTCAVWGAALVLADPPPQDALEAARAALSRAREAEADRYAPDLYREANDRWNAALEAWRLENERLAPLRDYAAARAASDEAVALGAAALDRALVVRDSLQALAEHEVGEAKARLTALRAKARRLPFDAGWQRDLALIHTALTERDGALDRGDLHTAADRARHSAALLDRLDRDLTETVEAYLADLPTWRQWHEETIAWSRRRRAPALVVDKMAHRLYLYEAGQLRDTFDVELGPDWMGQKRHEGDLATPEGRYFVRRKRGAGETRYDRALEIDYPNESDRRRFQEARRAGLLPEGARIGGLIEIHGHGGRGTDWTRGCVALPNDVMRRLFTRLPNGTPVTIVGALDNEHEWGTVNGE